MSRAFGALAILLVFASPVPARAGNDDGFLFGDHASMTGGAVVASIGETAAIWYNPAGLGKNRRGRLELSGTAFTLRWRQIPRGLALDLPTRRVERSISSRDVYVVPTALAAAREISQGLSLGVGLFVTEQDLFSFESNVHASDSTVDLDVAGALTGTEIRYHAGPAIGYQIAPSLRVGLSVLGVYENRHEFRKLFADARMVGTYDSTFLQRLVDARTTRLGLETVTGLQLEPGSDWALGLALHWPRWTYYEHAETDNSTAVISRGAAAPTLASSSVDHNPIGATGTGLTRAASLDAGVAKRLGSIELSAELEAQLVSLGGGQEERDVFNARAGALWHAADKTLLGLGVFTDRSRSRAPVTFPDSRVDYYGVAAGFKQRDILNLERGERASSLQFSTTVAIRYAIGIGESTRIRFDFRDAPTSGNVGRVADERVDVVYHELSLYLGTGFEF